MTDAQWALIEPLLPSSKGKRSRPFRDHRQVLEGIVLGYRTGRAARTRPDALLADTAYSSRAHRALLPCRGIKAVIPQQADQQHNRLRRGSLGGRPVSYDKLAVVFRGAATVRSILRWLRCPSGDRL